ncbi:hypothetical protein ABEB36_006905 [Hypothenemus hampei]|uniref:FAM21/CAPZIP domain-containing protein n=1 Tax=Hypothenemus hampei TaxID=57062 RepID=A0ABD1ESM4_HYPHA
MTDDNIQWTSEEMIANANNWSLKGDVAILNKLKKFSQTFLSETEALNIKVNNMLNQLEHVSLKLELKKNEFHSLRDTQFIENRVYEDDETLEPHQEEKVHGPTVEEKEEILKKAVITGLEVMRKYYDQIEVAVSDSEEEGPSRSYVLQEKDVYAHRLLPYLVGSENWYKKSHVGLLLSEPESESEKEEEEVCSSSSSSSRSDISKPSLKNHSSETSSELDLTTQSAGRREAPRSSDGSSDQTRTVPIKAPLSNEKFAEQLAEKLGDVISGKSVSKKPEPSKYGGLFSDEPPPLDEPDDAVLPNPARHSLFSEGTSLFADSADDLFKNVMEEKSLLKQNETSRENLSEKNAAKRNATKGLFNVSSSSSEEDMLTVTQKRKLQSTISKNPYLQSSKPVLPFVDDQPPDIIPKHEPKKKPLGGVSILGEHSGNIFANKERNTKLKKFNLFDDSSDEDMFLEKPKVDQESLQNKKQSLFEDPEETVTVADRGQTDNKKDYILPKTTTEFQEVQKPKLSLFDDSDELLSKEPQSIQEKTQSLFADLEESGDNNEIFKQPDQVQLKKPNLFIDSEDSLLLSSEENEESRKNNEDLKKSQSTYSKKISLFDDDDDEDDELFGKKDLFFTSKERKSLEKPVVALFEDLDDEEFSSNLKVCEEDLTTETVTREEDKVITTEVFQHLEDDITKKVDEKLENEETKTEIKSFQTPLDEEHEIPCTDVDKQSFLQEKYEEPKDETPIINTSSYEDIKNNDIEPVSNVETEVKDIKNMSFLDSLENDFDDLFLKNSNYKSSNEAPPSIALFDPTPPPIDWDTASHDSTDSDKLSFTEGILDLPEPTNQATPSSVFDEAPPSFDQVKDITAAINQSDNVDIFEDIFSIKQSDISERNVQSSISTQGYEKVEPILKEPSFKNDETVEQMNPQEPIAKASPGKLNRNININVKALLPGALPKFPARTQDSHIITNNENSQFKDLESTQVLQNVTKDRAKIVVKRRPSTRKARREAVKNSMTDFTLYPNLESEDVAFEPNKSGILDSVEKSEEKVIEIPPQNVASSVIEDLKTNKDEDIDFKSTLKQTVPQKTSLFSDKSDSDSGDDLFKVNRTKVVPEKTKTQVKKSSNIFDDSNDSDEDLFGGKTLKATSSSATIKRAEVKTATIKRLENKEASFDPLSGFRD